MNADYFKCTNCVLFVKHMEILLNELDREMSESTLHEIKSYYWLSTFFKLYIEQCSCENKILFENKVQVLQGVLDHNGIELDDKNKKCDICRVLPAEVFSLLDVACKIIEQESMDSMCEELEYHMVLMYLFEEHIGVCNDCDHFVEYLSNRNEMCEFLHSRDLKKLQHYVHRWKLATNSDEILSHKDVLNEAHNFYSKAVTIEFNKAVYLDFNIYSKYESEPGIKINIDEIIENSDIKIVCSPVHLEEILRMNNEENESIRLDSIKKLTKGLSIVVNDGKLIFCNDDLDGRFYAVKKYADLNNAAEERNCIRIEVREQLFNKYVDDNSLKHIGNTTLEAMVYNNNPATGEKMNESLPDESELNNILSYIGSSNRSIKDYHNIMNNEVVTFYSIRTAIDSIASVFNVLGFRADKVNRKNDSFAKYPIYHKDNYRTIRSGYYDNDHLSFATKCKYFVTLDRKLCARANEIFKYLGCETKSILLEDYIKLHPKKL